MLLSAAFLITAALPLAANTAIEPEAKPGEGWQRFHQRFLERARQGNIDILFLGDSITQYWEDPGRGLPVWQRVFLPRQAANFGINADRIQNVLWRIANGEAEGFSPKVVVLLIGTNNTGLEKDKVTPRNSTEEVVEGIGTVVAALQSRFPQAKILLLGLLPRGKKGAPQYDQIGKINRGISALDNGSKVRYLDIGPSFLDAQGEVKAELMPDLLHPNTQGYEVFASAIEKPLENLLAEPAR